MDEDNKSSTEQDLEDKSQITCHLVSLPKIVLTRIDEGKFSYLKSKAPQLKKPVKRLDAVNNKRPLPSKSTAKRILSVTTVQKPTRGRPKNTQNSRPHLSNSHKVGNNKLGFVHGSNKRKQSPKEKPVPQNSMIKNMLKKTMLQKRSKIAIPPAKKKKPIQTKSNRRELSWPKKQTLPKIMSPPVKTIETDSEDEFLYDELIEELENGPMNHSRVVIAEKTTNITLKPNSGSKPPTIVKGGIVKRINLPADLKAIDSPSKANVIKLGQSTQQRIPGTKNKIVEASSASTSPSKKPSPWPVSISSPLKPTSEPKIVNTQKKVISKPVVNKPPNKNLKLAPTDSIINSIESRPVILEPVKRKFGPKQTAKVVPLSKPSVEEDNLSDEYTEEETLENIDYEPDILSMSPNKDSIDHKDPKAEKNLSAKTSSCTVLTDDEDPHLDLLRILTDDSDDPTPQKPLDLVEEVVQCDPCDDVVVASTESPACDQANAAPSETPEEPKVRTIYDLMNEMSLQYPSWNLHILPETNAFCIAQVTKGRLGLPTLKKCIELDPVSYNAKVYIHQYHIKRFDGVYDSEESILALFQEIHSIKA